MWILEGHVGYAIANNAVVLHPACWFRKVSWLLESFQGHDHSFVDGYFLSLVHPLTMQIIMVAMSAPHMRLLKKLFYEVTIKTVKFRLQ